MKKFGKIGSDIVEYGGLLNHSTFVSVLNSNFYVSINITYAL